MRAFSYPRFLAGFLSALVLLAPSLNGQAQIFIWSGTADWSSAANWSPLSLPGLSNTAQISTGTATVSDTRSIGTLTLSGGTINGAGSLTIVGTNSTWTSGALSGSGQFAIGGGADFAINGASAKVLNARALVNSGSITWSGGTLGTGNGATISNASGATFTTDFDGTLANNQSGTRAVFDNAGTFSKTAGSSITDIQATFNNTGTVNASSGTLQFSGGGTDSGAMNVAGGATLRLATNNFSFTNGAQISGGGTLDLASSAITFSGATASSAAVNISGATATFNGSHAATGNLTLSSGTIAGTGTLTISPGFFWTGGTVSSPVIVNGSTSISSATTKSLTGQLTLSGNTNWTGGQINVGGSGPAIVNNATFATNFDGTIAYNLGGTGPIFSNAGTFTKTGGAAITDIGIVFNNTGTLNVDTGTVRLFGGGTSSGAFTTNGTNSAIVRLTSNYSFTNGAQLNGTGTLDLNNGTTTFTGATTSTARITITGATTNFNGTHTSSGPSGNLTLSSGTLTGTGTATVTGFSWTGGAMNGALTSNGATTISGSNGKTFTTGGLLTLTAATMWTGGSINSGGGATLINNSIFTTDFDGTFAYNQGGSRSTFSNSGTFTKSGGTGTTDIQATFNNTGAITANSGALQFSGGGSMAGTVAIGSLGGLVLTSGTYAWTAPVTGTGTFTVNSGTLSLDAATSAFSNLTLNGGTVGGTAQTSIGALTSTGGSLAIPSLTLTGASTWTATNWGTTGATSVTISSTGSLSLSGSDHQFDNRSITNNGTVTWSGGWLRSGHGAAVLNNLAWNDTNPGNVNADAPFGGSWSFTNAVGATYTKSGAGTTTFNVPFNNSGAVSLTGGTLSLNGGNDTAATGTFNVGSGSGLNFGGGTYNLANGSSLIGTGTFSVTGGTLAVNAGTANLPNFTLTSGTFGGAGSAIIGTLTQSSGNIAIGSLTLTGASSTWSGGNWTSTASSTATINSGVTLALSGGDHQFDFRSITNNGTVTWSGGWLRSGHGGAVINNLAWNDTNAGNVNADNPFGGSWSFTNAAGGTYTKSGAGTTTFNVPFNNNGAVSVTSGMLSLNGGDDTIATGTFNVGAGGSLRFAGGTYSLADGSSLTGTGTFSITGGTLAVNAGAANLSNLTVAGGTFSGPGTATVAALTQTGGIIALNSLTLSGSSTWSGGTWTSTAASLATINSGVTLALSASDHQFDFRSITNNGTVNWSGGWLRSGHGASVLNNLAWNDTNTGSVTADNPFGGVWSFTNAAGGTYTKSGSGTTTFNVPFNNSGAVSITDGTLSLNNGNDTVATGTFTVGSTGGLRFGGGTYNLANGSLLTGTGAFSVTGGTLAVNAGAANLSNLTVAGGTLDGAGTATLGALTETSGNIAISSLTLAGASSTWSGGTWTSAAPSLATINAGVTLLLSANDHPFDFRSITNNGTVTWSGGWLRSGHGASVINNLAWNDTNTGSVSADAPFGGSWSFTNAAGGIYAKSGNATTTFNVPFNNNGAVNLTAGTLTLSNGGATSGAGTFNAASGTTVNFNGGASTIASGASLAGAGTYQLSGGTLSIDGNITVSTFNQTNGTLAGTQTLLGGTFNWSGGNWNAGATGFSSTIGSGVALNLLANNVHDFDYRAIINQGTITWAGNYIRSGHGGSFTNAASFSDQASTGTNYIQPAYTGLFTFTNNGTYSKNGASVTEIQAVFNNNAAVSVQAGTLRLNGGGTNSGTGTFQTASGAFTDFNGDYAIVDGTGLTGPGTYLLTGGTLNVGGNITVSTFNQTSGILAGTQTLLGGTFNWSGGNWNAGALGSTTTIGSGATLNLLTNNVHDFDYRAVVNQGTVNWLGNHFRSGDGGSFTNANHASFNDQSNTGTNYIYPVFGGVFTFTNAGTYSKTGTAVTEMQAVFNNDAAVSVQAGRLRISGGGTNSSTGSFQTAAGAATEFAGNYTIADGTALSGAGVYELTNGTLTVSGNITVSTFNQTGGTLAGTQTLLGGTYNWTGGNWNASAPGFSTTIGAGVTLNLDSANVHDFDYRAVTNQGTVNWIGSYIRSGDGGSFTNAAGAHFNDQGTTGTNYIFPAYGGAFTFTNNGIYAKTGSGTTEIQTVFNNNASVSVQAGTLRLNGGGTNSGPGSIQNASGATMEFHANFTIPGPALTGPGTYVLSGGTLTLDGDVLTTAFNQTGGVLAGSQNLLGGLFTWSSGSWNAAAPGPATTIGPGATVVFDDTTTHDFDYRAVTNQGTVNWVGNYIRSGHGGSFTNAAGALFNDQSSVVTNYIYSAYGGVFTFTNNGTYRKTGSAATEIQTAFNNNGSLLLEAGSTHFTSTFTQSGGTIAVLNNSSVRFDQNLNLAAGSLVGAGTVQGSVTSSGLISPGFSSRDQLNVTGSLTLLSASTLLLEIGGLEDSDYLNVTGAITLNGTLQLALVNGYIPSAGNSFFVANAASLAGAFTNVPLTGLRLNTIDNLGSFQVNFGAGSAFATNSLVLSNFVAVPEPSTWALLGLGALTLAVTTWRNRRRR